MPDPTVMVYWRPAVDRSWQRRWGTPLVRDAVLLRTLQATGGHTCHSFVHAIRKGAMFYESCVAFTLPPTSD